eukprot:352122-Chlamydomonas_euryale.AAC.2
MSGGISSDPTHEHVTFYEVTVASADRPKLLSRLSEALVRHSTGSGGNREVAACSNQHACVLLQGCHMHAHQIHVHRAGMHVSTMHARTNSVQQLFHAYMYAHSWLQLHTHDCSYGACLSLPHACLHSLHACLHTSACLPAHSACLRAR